MNTSYPTMSLKNKNPAIVSSSVVVPKPDPKQPSKGPDYTPPSNPEKVFFAGIKDKRVMIQTILGEEIVGVFEYESKYHVYIRTDAGQRLVMKHGIIWIDPDEDR
jgi:sRNA-binding regulator protein Hfq